MKNKIEKVIKEKSLLRNLLGVSNKDMDKWVKDGFPIVYVWEVYPYGGGDDQIKIASFKNPLSEDLLQKRFRSSKIRGTLCGPVCEIDLRKAE